MVQQAIERAWGIVKSAVARQPTYKLSAAMEKLEHEFRARLGPAVCKKLCDKVSITAKEYYMHDLKQYGPDGFAPDRMCARPLCPLAGMEHEARGDGTFAREIEVRQCSDCGWSYHKNCLLDGQVEEKKKVMWPEGRSACRCGCADEDDKDSDASSRDSEGEGQEDHVEQGHGRNLVAHIKSLIESSRSIQGISKGKGPGDMSQAR